MSKINRDAIKALVEVLTSDESIPCPYETSFGCSRYIDADNCAIMSSDICAISKCWEIALAGEKKKKRKMDKVTKALMKYATDGGRKTTYFCPVDAGFKCVDEAGPRGCAYASSEAEGTITMCDVSSTKKLRKCWKKVYEKERCSTNE